MPSTLSPSSSATAYTLGISHTFKVDPATGRFSDLQLMAAGREAKGHGYYIDGKTLETSHAAIKERGGRLKAYRTHDHSGPASWSWEEGSELDIVGFFSAIDLKAEQLIAGSFEFYDSFKVDEAKAYKRILEIAEKTPELIALSVEIWGYLVFVAKDGTEYSQRPDDVELLYDGMPALRVTDMWAAAFVSDGAATDGLFAKLNARMEHLFGRMFGDKQSAAQPPAESPTLHFPSLSKGTSANNPTIQSPTMLSLAQITAKFGPDKARLSQALLLAADKPETTIEAIETALAAADQAAKDKKLSDLTAELATAKKTAEDAAAVHAQALATVQKSVTDLTKERDEWKSKYETLKNSGVPKEQDLGATSGGAGAANPWAEATKNYTRQAELLASNPTLANQLKAAAENPAK